MLLRRSIGAAMRPIALRDPRSLQTVKRWQCQVLASSASVAAKDDPTDTALKDDSDVGDDEDTANTGIIRKDKHESLIYFDYLYPYFSSKWDIRAYLGMLIFPATEKAILKRVKHVITDQGGDTTEYEIKSVQPMRRDGGAFVKFQLPLDVPIQDFNKRLLKTVNHTAGSYFMNTLFAARCYPVKGKPWIEDLRRYPSKKAKVSFDGPELSQEDLYLLFRRYGVILDIEPPKPDSKETLKSATITFRITRSAITAKNCLNGYKLNDTTLHIQFIPENRENIVWDFVMNHQRISIPLIVTLLTALAFFVFEPVREWCVKERISQRHSLKNNEFYKTVITWTNSTTSRFKQLIYANKDSHRKEKINQLWLERYEKVRELKLWLEENVNTFIVIRGPRGSGKHEMVVDHALKDRDNVLVLDCDALLKARSDQKLIAAVAQQIGYFPSFAWLNSLTSFVDLGLQGLIGQKSGISESKEQQVRSMFNTALAAIRDLSLEDYAHEVPEIMDGQKEEKALKEEDYLQARPEKKPVVVIDRFQPTKKANERNAFIYREIADWAANLVSMNVAHVIFITDDIGSASHLSESLPDQVFKTSTLSDASAESARNYVLNQLQDLTASTAVLDTLDQTIKPLGGRMLDLQAFVRRIKSGESPKEAITEMIVQTSEQLTQVYFNKPHDKFSSSHAWIIMKRLANEGQLDFSDISLHPLFKSNPDEVLTALESSELIALVKDRGLIKSIRPGKPLFKASFENLVNDEQISKDLEIRYYTEMIGFENKRIAKWVDEIGRFGNFTDLSNNKMFKPRLEYLADKIRASTDVIVASEKAIKSLSK